MKNAKGVTHTGYVRGAVFGNDEKHVLFFTGMDLNQLYDLKHDMGERWCKLWFMANGFDAAEASSAWREPEIMQVWNNRWRLMDNEIAPLLHKVIPGERLDFYNDFHLGIFNNENPHYKWLEIGMAKACGRISKAPCKGELSVRNGKLTIKGIFNYKKKVA